MKKRVFGMTAALFALMLALFAGAYAVDTNAAELSEASDVYAILYEDGEMVFQYGDATDGRAVKKMYPVDLNAVYQYTPDVPWHDERKTVFVVNFADKISPVSTKLWFYQFENLERVDNIRNLNTAKVTNMHGMFSYCGALTALDVSRFKTAKVTDMHGMFQDCSGLTALNVSKFNTANVTDMSWMFYGCSGLKSLNVSKFNTAKVTDMSWMFKGCSGLKALNVSKFNTANVTDMSWMFYGCSKLKTIYASDMFTTVSVVDTVEEGGCIIPPPIRDNSLWMFSHCQSLVGGAGTKYDENHTNKEYARIDTSSASGYFTSKTAFGAYEITAAAPDNGKLSVTLTNPDAVTLAAAYFDASGKCVGVKLQSVGANVGIIALELSTGAAKARVMLLDDDFRPLCATYPVTL